LSLSEAHQAGNYTILTLTRPIFSPAYTSGTITVRWPGLPSWTSEHCADAASVIKPSTFATDFPGDRSGCLLQRGFVAVDGHTATYFWDAQVDDNAFLSLRTVGGQTAWLREQHRMEEPVFFISVSEASTLYLSNVSEASRFASFERKQKRAFLAKDISPACKAGTHLISPVICNCDMRVVGQQS
jgi:hypothetical protein